jgi:hypothetical protein
MPWKKRETHSDSSEHAAAQEGAQVSDHLYVMLNQWNGMIKIGRSRDPKKRRRQIEGATGQEIALVLVLEGRGHEEARLHSLLRSHRGRGEWFRRTGSCVAMLNQALGTKVNYLPPYA